MTLRELRLQKNLTQLELAELIGVDPAHISYMESGDRKPSLKTLTKLAYALNVSDRDFIKFVRSFSESE
ncbi:MAG TPA: helix-turn-helix transcriptional regulator [Rectinema sp.]|nr:MAG: antitoxin HipB [Thermotogota bacterium ADurb.Bin062]HPB88503.1 helix-turn-helix transcriptional regulator [Thermotogota bacterium]HQL17459.1 helix-turn-helix transcriptional regulator [Rectinema sp.]HQN23235.1 helix-turn-helix transcriptional regulator [Thermotogota bacterium]